MRITLLLLGLLIAGKLQTQAQVKRVNLPQLQACISNQDTVYVVNFWATWCAPCVKELPYFDQLQKKHPGQALKVLLVSMDFQSKYADVLSFARKHPFLPKFYQAVRNSDQEFVDGIDKSWSGALPATLIINKNKGIKQFFEKEFTFDELEKLYQTYK